MNFIIKVYVFRMNIILQVIELMLPETQHPLNLELKIKNVYSRPFMWMISLTFDRRHIGKCIYGFSENWIVIQFVSLVFIMEFLKYSQLKITCDLSSQQTKRRQCRAAKAFYLGDKCRKVCFSFSPSSSKCHINARTPSENTFANIGKPRIKTDRKKCSGSECGEFLSISDIRTMSSALAKALECVYVILVVGSMFCVKKKESFTEQNSFQFGTKPECYAI